MRPARRPARPARGVSAVFHFAAMQRRPVTPFEASDASQAISGFARSVRSEKTWTRMIRFRAKLNRCIKEYSEIVAAVADKERCGYVPLHEAIAEAIRNWPGRAFTAFR